MIVGNIHKFQLNVRMKQKKKNVESHHYLISLKRTQKVSSKYQLINE